jgi:hypothetical protein
MITLKQNQVPEVPKTVVACPICGDVVTLEITEWSKEYDGSWKASEYGFTTSCLSEPDITDEGYDNWLDGHFQHPYIDWLPVSEKIMAWLEENYRFEMDTEA